MELNTIGGRCEAHLCGDLDFLPITCGGCQRLFCRHHIALDAHACASLAARHVRDVSALQSQRADAGVPGRAQCAHESCHELALEVAIVDSTEREHRTVAVCAHCARAFCTVHRHASDHGCTMVPHAPPPAQRNPTAHALLSKHFPPASAAAGPAARTQTKAAAKLPTDPKKLARLRAVELMKMRHHARPADPRDKAASVPPTERLHLKVTRGTPPSEKIFWLRKTIGTGRALDLLATQFSVPISDLTPAFLDKLSPESDSPNRLQNDKPLSEQVQDGDTLLLSSDTDTVVP